MYAHLNLIFFSKTRLNIKRNSSDFSIFYAVVKWSKKTQ